MGQSNKFVDSSRLGVIILSIFALVWAIAAMVLSTVPLTLTVPAAAMVFIAAAAIITIANSRRFVAVDEQQLPMAPRQRRTIFIAANIVQAILFSVLLSVCIALDELAYIPLGGSVIVGAHLIPIGLSFGEKAFMVGGSLLVLTGISGLVVSWVLFTTSAFASGVVSLLNALVLIGLAAVQLRLYSTAA